MELKFLGAAQTVTGSKFLVSEKDCRVLIDCGLFQGFKHLRLKNWEQPGLDPLKLDAVVLTHAHLDHSGYLPVLYKRGFRGPVYCTPATAELCKIMLLDAGHLQEEEARLANKRGFSKHKPALPLYTVDDARATLALFKPVRWDEELPIKHLRVRLVPAGHLLGAASVHVTGEGGTILFSGDLGRTSDPIMRPPARPPAADWVVMESTYGSRVHVNADAEEELEQIISRTIQRGGTVLIPSFAVGRAQLIMYFLHHLRSRGKLAGVPIYLNSPMAKTVNGIFADFPAEHRLSREQAREVCAVAEYVASVEESIAVNESKRPKVIIAASGMASGGRVLHHLKTYAPDPRSSVVFVGFQAGGTRGEAMINGAERIKIHGEYWPINCEVHHLDSLSAHADSDELADWVRNLPSAPSRIFLAHGEPASAEALRIRLQEELRLAAEVPDMLSSYRLG